MASYLTDECRIYPAESKEKRPRGSWGLVVLLFLAGYVLFAHGCHGDEDYELLVRREASPIEISGGPPSPSAAETAGSAACDPEWSDCSRVG
jgi:hypothetical protein